MHILPAASIPKPRGPKVIRLQKPALALVTVLLSLAAAGQQGQRGQAGSPSEPGSSKELPASSMEAHFAAATKAQQLQHYPEAEKEYKAILALKPDFAEVHMNLGLVYQLENRDEDATVQFLRALKIKPSLSGANFFLGVNYCKMGNGAKAIAYLAAAVEGEPDRPDLRVWLATAYEMTGQIEAEVATIGRALELQPASVDLLYLQGHAYERMGKNEVAAIEERAPGSSRAEQLLAESYAAGNNWATAVVHFENAIAASPQCPGLHVELGEVLLRAGKVARALEAFEEELKLDPHSVRAFVRRGEAKWMQGDMSGLLADWSEAIRIDAPETERVLGLRETGFEDPAYQRLPAESREKFAQSVAALKALHTPAAQLALAFIAAQQAPSGVMESAMPAIEGASELHDASTCSQATMREALEQGRASSTESCLVQLLGGNLSPEFRLRIAAALFEAGSYGAGLQALAGLPPSAQHTPDAAYWRARCYEKLATAAYLKLYQADRSSYRVHQLLGDLSAAQGNDVTAIEEYRAAIALRPSLPNLHYSLGHLLWKNSQVPEARVELQAELALNRHHSGALYDLGQTYLLEQQPAKALSYLTQAVAEGFDNAEMHRDLGTAYSQLGNYQKAAAEFDKAVASDQDGSIHFKLAKVYKTLGEKEKAAHEYAVAANLNRELHRKTVAQAERIAEIER